MRIFIISIDDPIYTNDFIKNIIDNRKEDIVGVAITQGDKLTIRKKRSKIVYLMSLILIMGVSFYMKLSLKKIRFLLQRFLSKRIQSVGDLSLFAYAKARGIETSRIKTPNSRSFVENLKVLDVDVIISQSQNILKKEILKVPRIGVLNRHNALLPKNRGRLSPFWALYYKNVRTGVSIHFVDEGIDSGGIITQMGFDIEKNSTFESITRKCYKIADELILEALEILETGEYRVIDNDDSLATYNTIPSFKEALRFRLSRMGLNKL
ncbi:formyltransferase family protein [Acidobacteriota bacterium]